MTPAALTITSYLVCLPLASIAVGSLGGHDLARIAEVVLFVVCGATLAIQSVTGRDARPGAITCLAVAAFAVLAAASALGAASLAVAGREAATVAGLVAVAWCVQRSGRLAAHLPAVTAGTTALYAVVLCLLVLANLLQGLAPARLSLFVGYDNYRFYNHVQTVALPLALVGAAVGRVRWVRGLSIVALVCGFAMLFASAGRGTALALMAAAATIGVLGGRRSAAALLARFAGTAIAGLLLFLAMFVVLPGSLVDQPPAFADYGVDRLASDQARWPLWAAAWEMIRAAPWLGAGPGHYALLPGLKAAHPHNVYLQVAAEWGLPMAVLAAAAAVALLNRLRRAIQRADDDGERRTGLALAGAWVAVLVDGLVSGNFVMPVSQVWIAVLIGWAWRWSRDVDATGVPGGVPTMASPGSLAGALAWAWRGVALAAGALTVWLAVSVWPQATQLQAHLNAQRLQAPGARENPRFWSNGRP